MKPTRGRLATLISAGLAAVMGAPATAQTSTPSTPGIDGDLPWYIGVGQGFFHDTNVYRVPDGSGDTYSSTTVFGGFDQRLGRQRLHGSGSVALNRYFDEKPLDNTSYDFDLGLDWETVYSLSGSVNAGIREHLAYPAPTSGLPNQTKNLGLTKWAGAQARWGGTSLFTIEGTAHYSSIEYSDEAYASRESETASGGLAVYYGGGGPLRVGLGGRYERTETPKAGFDPLVPEFLSNTATGRNVDFFLDYAVTGKIKTNLRLSYTDRKNTLIEASDFKGWTGRLASTWQATGKVAFSAYASRDTGSDSGFGSVTFVPPGSPPGSPPVTRLYDNNRLTHAFDLSALYSATAKISVSAGIHYTKADLVSTASDLVTPVESTDRQKVFYLGADYAFLRNGVAACRLTRELRDVSGGGPYSYSSTLFGCHARLVYRS